MAQSPRDCIGKPLLLAALLWVLLGGGSVFTGSILHTAKNNLDTNCVPTSVISFEGIPKLARQRSERMQAAVVGLAFMVRMALVDLLYLSVITTTN